MQPAFPLVGLAQAVGIERGVEGLPVHSPAAHDAVRVRERELGLPRLRIVGRAAELHVVRHRERRVARVGAPYVRTHRAAGAEPVARLVVALLVIEEAIHVVAAERPGVVGIARDGRPVRPAPHEPRAQPLGPLAPRADPRDRVLCVVHVSPERAHVLRELPEHQVAPVLPEVLARGPVRGGGQGAGRIGLGRHLRRHGVVAVRVRVPEDHLAVRDHVGRGALREADEVRVRDPVAKAEVLLAEHGILRSRLEHEHGPYAVGLREVRLDERLQLGVALRGAARAEHRQQAVHGPARSAPCPSTRVARPVVPEASRAVGLCEALLKGQAEAAPRDGVERQRLEARIREREVDADIADEGRLLPRGPAVFAELQHLEALADPPARARRVGDLEEGIARRRVVPVTVEHEALDLFEVQRGSLGRDVRARAHVSLRNHASRSPASAPS